MLETLGLILCGFIGMCCSITQMKKVNYQYPGIKNILLMLLMVCGVCPLMEEAVFRHTLKYYMSDLTYAYYINAILFGLSHSVNYVLTQSISLTVYQIIMTTYLGYYVVQFDNFLYALLTHSLYNFLITSFALSWHFYFQEKSDDQFEPILYEPKIWHPKITRDDIHVGYSQKSQKLQKLLIGTSRKKINKETLDRIDKLYEIENKRSPFKFSY